LPRESVLKINHDIHVRPHLEREYVQQTVANLRRCHENVGWIKATRTHHGSHYYIKIDPPVEAHTANNLQYLLGDDARRVDYNRARINSRLAHWNILFERVNCKMRALYRRSRE
jgi:hypothetical protein